MNALRFFLAGTIAFSVALPALAGPDWQAIEQARAHKGTQLAQADKPAPTDKCPVKRLVLPVDHGPHAQTTPYLNEQRRKRWEAEQKACAEAAAKGTAQSAVASVSA